MINAPISTRIRTMPMDDQKINYRHPGIFAARTPDRSAVIMGMSSARLSFAEFEAISNRFAHLLRRLGVAHGDRVAVFLENHLLYMPLAWGAFRSGLRFVAVAVHLAAEEIDYILEDSGARVLVTSTAMATRATLLRMTNIPNANRLMLDGVEARFTALEPALEVLPGTPIADQAEGVEMLYSSGTTGRPKGILKAMPSNPFGVPAAGYWLTTKIYDIDERTIYLSPAPLYHAAPLMFCLRCLRFGATIVIMEKFDAEQALRLIERHKVTHSQWVPTMFVRMLRLTDETRQAIDLSSLRYAIHAAAPCPIDVKRRIIDWFGPIVWEYYGGSEGNGLTVLDSQEWLAHPGSVGRAKIGRVRICGADGEELPVGQEGTVYFSDNPAFAYHNDPEKTTDAHNQHGWSTLGDIGYVDDEDYLYLTDRKANMIISGGVNIYPQEAENLLLSHPQVIDAAVIGVPNAEFGEEVKAIVHPVDMAAAGPELETALIAFCRESLSHVKCPRSVDFNDDLPRRENGKLYKRLLKDRYWAGHDKQIGGGNAGSGDGRARTAPSQLCLVPRPDQVF
jgi:long-chain acyl-CoA synthetase